MPQTIHWRLMFRVDNQAALDKCLAEALATLGSGSVADDGKPYWKMPELWECSVMSPAVGSVAEQVFECLVLAYRLGSGWQVFGRLSPDSASEFGGVLAVGKNGASARVASLEWTSFNLVDGVA